MVSFESYFSVAVVVVVVTAVVYIKSTQKCTKLDSLKYARTYPLTDYYKIYPIIETYAHAQGDFIIVTLATHKLDVYCPPISPL